MLLLLLLFCLNLRYFSVAQCRPSNRWTIERVGRGSSKDVTVLDNTIHNINWRWEAIGGHWNVSYFYTYPSEWYKGKATFVDATSGANAFVAWGSNVQWTSNAVLISDPNPWTIKYNGDSFGFVPTQNGRYIFRVFTRCKRHDPFRQSQPVVRCTYPYNDNSKMSQWWEEVRLTPNCREPTLYRSWAGNSGTWTVNYRYITNSKTTLCDIYYKTHVQPQVRVISWGVDNLNQFVCYSVTPVRIMEKSWQFNLGPSERWGVTPTGDGVWVFQHFSQNLAIRPFQDFRRVILHASTPEVVFRRSMRNDTNEQRAISPIVFAII